MRREFEKSSASRPFDHFLARRSVPQHTGPRAPVSTAGRRATPRPLFVATAFRPADRDARVGRAATWSRFDGSLFLKCGTCSRKVVHLGHSIIFLHIAAQSLEEVVEPPL